MSLSIRLRHTKTRSVILRLCVIDYLPVRVRSYTKYSCCTKKNLKQKTEQAALGSLPASIVFFFFCIAQKTGWLFRLGIGDWFHCSLINCSCFKQTIKASRRLRKGNGAHSSFRVLQNHKMVRADFDLLAHTASFLREKVKGLSDSRKQSFVSRKEK